MKRYEYFVYHLHVNEPPSSVSPAVSIVSPQRSEMLITISFLHVLVTRHVVLRRA